MIKTAKQTLNTVNGVSFITFKKLEKYPQLKHAFSTRLGGVSDGYYSSMNLSFSVGDNPDTVKENYRILCNAVGIDSENIIISHQTHKTNILSVTKSDCGKNIWRERDYSDIDALITNEKGVAIVTHSADCCLLGFFDPKQNVIAAAHAGWRGTVAEIGKKTVEKMVKDYNCNPNDILVIIAPSISKCCYEVDDPVLNEFKKLSYLDLSKIFFPKENGRYMLDLWEANLQILTNAGVKPENVEITDICTNCQSEYFHSHRATGGKRGVNGLIMELK